MTETATGDPGKADGLRLRACDKEDVQVIAACLQDALIPLREMAFMAEERRFLAAFNRFQWERLADPVDASGLTLCQSVLRIDHVDNETGVNIGRSSGEGDPTGGAWLAVCGPDTIDSR